jgi:hypothetical protein
MHLPSKSIHILSEKEYTMHAPPIKGHAQDTEGALSAQDTGGTTGYIKEHAQDTRLQQVRAYEQQLMSRGSYRQRLLVEGSQFTQEYLMSLWEN